MQQQFRIRWYTFVSYCRLRCLLNAQIIYICLANLAANTAVFYRKTMQWPLQGETLNNLTMLYRSRALFRTFATNWRRRPGQNYRLQRKRETHHIRRRSGVLKARNVEETYRRLNSELGWSDLIFMLLPLKESQIKKRRFVSVKKNN